MSYRINLNDKQMTEIVNKYQDYRIAHTNNYTLFRAKYKMATLTIFKTLTMIVQGGGAKEMYNDICGLLGLDATCEAEAINKTTELNLSVIGTDEVGTGDFFGPVVVAGAFVPENKIPALIRLGIKDSKQVNDEKIRILAPKLMKELQHSILVLDNVKYNYLTRIRHYNMNKIKALLHNNVVYNLMSTVKNYDRIVIDAFTTKDKYFEYLKGEKIKIANVELVEKGESKFLAVAAASIIARYAFICEFEKLSQKVGLDLPKGAGNKVDLAISKILKSQSERYFDIISKTNFKNFERVKRKDSN